MFSYAHLFVGEDACYFFPKEPFSNDLLPDIQRQHLVQTADVQAAIGEDGTSPGIFAGEGLEAAEFLKGRRRGFRQTELAALAIEDEFAISRDERAFPIAPSAPLHPATFPVKAFEFAIVVTVQKAIQEHTTVDVISHVLVPPKFGGASGRSLDQSASVTIASGEE